MRLASVLLRDLLRSFSLPLAYRFPFFGIEKVEPAILEGPHWIGMGSLWDPYAILVRYSQDA